MKIRNKQTGQIIEVTEDQLADYGLSPMAKGGMIKRADGSYSRHGLWDSIRANKGSGRKPTKEMLKQEKKIRAAEKAYGGYMQMGGGLTDWFMATGGGINNPGFRALPDYVQKKIIDNMAYGGYLPMAEEGDGIPYREPLMMAPTVIEEEQPFTTIQRTLPEGVTYSSQIPFQMGAVSDYGISAPMIPAPVVQKAAAPKNLGLVDYLASMNMAFDKESRKKLAKELGITGYDFSAAKNTELLKKLKEKGSKAAPKGSMANPVVLPEFTVTAGRKGSPIGTKANPVVLPEFVAEPRPDAVEVLRNYVQGPGRAPYLNAPPQSPLQRTLSNLPPSALRAAEQNLYSRTPFSSYTKDLEKAAAEKKKQPKAAEKDRNIFQRAVEFFGGKEALPYFLQENGGYMASGGCMECGGKMAEGGKLPKEILRARLESHMSPGEAQDYLSSYGMGGYLDEAAEGKWIQKATASIKRRGTEGVCTGSKFGSSSCPPGSKRYNLAKTFRKMAKSRKKEDGGYALGSEHEMTDSQIANLRAMGYKIKEV